MSKKIKKPKPNKAYGFLGLWINDKAGWMGLSHIGGSREDPDYPYDKDEERNEIMKGERLYLCEIIVKPVFDKKGRPITRIVK